MKTLELKKLSRQELLEILLQQAKENKALNEENEMLKKKLETREIITAESGTIAEAALKLNLVFEAADNACRQYIDSIKGYETVCEQKLKAAEEEAASIICKAREDADKLKKLAAE